MQAELQQRFKAVVDKVRNAPEDGRFKPLNDYKLKMYTRYRQATVSDVQGKKPSVTNPIASYKWPAWAGLKGRLREQAMAEYPAEFEPVEADDG